MTRNMNYKAKAKLAKLDQARLLALSLKEAEEWLQECPFDDGQPFYETAQRPIDEWSERLTLLVLDTADPATVETIRGWVEEGEWPAPDGNEPDAAEVWDKISDLLNEELNRC